MKTASAAATATDRTYSGWTNYETYLVKVWMDNDSKSQAYWRAAARNPALPAEAYALSLHIKKKHKDAGADVIAFAVSVARSRGLRGADLFADLLKGAMDAVNWFEIAEHLIEEHED